MHTRCRMHRDRTETIIHLCCPITNDGMFHHMVKTASPYWNGVKQYLQVFTSGEKHKALHFYDLIDKISNSSGSNTGI